MSYKIKVKPSDFIVDEVAKLPLAKNGRYGVYILEKSGWNTIDALLDVSKKLEVSFNNFAYGGRKDRYSLSRQYVSIIGKIEHHNVDGHRYLFKFVGCMHRPMGPDLIQGNEFNITLRNVDKESQEDILRALNEASIGYPNYYDDQRFGSYSPRQGFLAEKLLRKEHNGALKIYLTSIYKDDKKTYKDRKRLFFEHWRDWSKCRESAISDFEKKAFDYLIDKPTAFVDLLKLIPRHELSAYISAYQAFLWNEMLRRVVKTKFGDRFLVCDGLAGEYVFPGSQGDAGVNYRNNFLIPTPAAKITLNDEFIASVYNQVLEDNRIVGAMFNKVKLRQAYFKSFLRPAFIKPENLSFNFEDDDLYLERKKLVLRFFLPRGSYATMFLKRIFALEGQRV